LPSDLDPQHRANAKGVVADSESAENSGRRRGSAFLAMSAAGVVLGFGLLSLLSGGSERDSPSDEEVFEEALDVVVPPETIPATTELSETDVATTLVQRYVSIGGIPDSGSPDTLPIRGWLPGDDGAGPLPLGVVDLLPGNRYLDFLVEWCNDERCFRDARMKNIEGSGDAPDPGSDPVPFVVRHGFPNTGDDALGEGYGVDVYITRRSGPRLDEEIFVLGQTYKFTSDYVVRGTANECGPLYQEQSDPVECEWFVHDFPDGIPAGRYDLWTVWRAPCFAWMEMELTFFCVNNDVVSMFSASVNSPFGNSLPAVDWTLSAVDWTISLTDPDYDPGVHSIFTIAEARPLTEDTIEDLYGYLVWDGETVVDLCNVGVREVGNGYVHIGDGYQTTEGCGDNPNAMQEAFDLLGMPDIACVGVTAYGSSHEYCAPLNEV